MFYTEGGKLMDICTSGFLNESYLRQIDFAILAWKGGFSVDTIG